VQNLLSEQKYKKKKKSITSLAIYRIYKKIELSINICIYSINFIKKARRDCFFCFFRKTKIVLLYNFIKKVRKAETIL